MKKFITKITALVLVLAFSMPAFAGVSISPPKSYASVAAKCRGRADDVISMAKTQDGYKGVIKNKGKSSEKRYSYFGNSWDKRLSEKNKKSNTGNWCSEFASWCMVQAKVPGARPLVGVEEWRDAYRGSLFKMYASAENASKDKKTRASVVKKWFANYKSNGTLKLKDLRKGDVLQILTDEKLKKGKREPHHTAIFAGKVKGNNVYVVEGNVDASSSHSRVRINGVYDAREVIAVIRPVYRG